MLNEKQKLTYIDALRGWAILSVLLVHALKCGSKDLYFPEALKYAIGNGARGVQLFFIVSAFTLFLSFTNRNEKEEHPTLFFFIRRFFRIAPLYYLGIAYYLWQDGFGPRYWIGDEASIGVMHILSNIFFMHSFHPHWINSVVPGGWSIGVEMIFYCLVPFLFERIKNCKQAFNFLILTIALRMFLEILLKLSPEYSSNAFFNEYFFLSLPSQLPVFAAGILVFFIIKEGYTFSVSPLSVLILACMLIANHLTGHAVIFPTYLLFTLGFVLLLLALSRRTYAVFVNPFLVFIGTISYSMYLSHFAVLYWIEETGFGDFVNVTGTGPAIVNYAIRFLVVLFITVSISWLMYQALELPLQKLAKKIIRKISEYKESDLAVRHHKV